MRDILPWVSVFFNVIAAICFLVSIFLVRGNKEMNRDFQTFGWAFFAMGFLLLFASAL